MLLATCCEDDIVPHVLPFIKEHIKNPDWRYRDAAVMAFGCILEGPEPNQLKPLVIQVGFGGFSWSLRTETSRFIWRRIPALRVVLNLRKSKRMPLFYSILEKLGRRWQAVGLNHGDVQDASGSRNFELVHLGNNFMNLKIRGQWPNWV